MGALSAPRINKPTELSRSGSCSQSRKKMKNEKLQGGLCPKSQKTNHEPLKFALEKVHRYGYTNNKLDNDYKLHVCRQTLSKIEKGKYPVGKEQHYMRVFVRTLNNERLKATHENDEVKQAMIERDLLDILLVSFGIATDDEMQEMENEKRKRAILEELGIVNIKPSR